MGQRNRRKRFELLAPEAKRDIPLLLTAALVFLSTVAGGGGAEAPVVNGALEIAAAFVLSLCVARHLLGEPVPSSLAGPIWFMVAVLLLIVVQLIPLPPSMWSELPGREIAVAVGEISALQNHWRPISMDPEATRRFAAALLLPAAVVIAGFPREDWHVRVMVRAVVMGALAGAVLGVVQVTLGSPSQLSIYGDEGYRGIARGFYINPNHQGQLMLLGLVATGLMIRLQSRTYAPHARRKFGPYWLLFPLFAVAALGTQSRAVLILLLPATTVGVLLASGLTGKLRFLLAASVVVVIAVGVTLLAPNDASAIRQLRNFFGGEEHRLISLPDILYTLRLYWPVGSGLGTFDPVYRASENLEIVTPLYLNRAHNEILELLIEAGLPAALVMTVAALGVIVRLATNVRDRAKFALSPAVAGAAMLLFLMLHSLVDYPLRMRGIAAVASVAILLVFCRLPKRKSLQEPRKTCESSIVIREPGRA